MKKFYALLSAASIAAISSVSAQQLPNAGFEGTWSTATPFTTSTAKPVTIGENPENWVISHVTGMTGSFLNGTGKKALGSNVAGYNSSSAVELKNAETGALSITRNVPGYLTTGTTWSTAVSLNKTDGGTFGSIPFTYRPDAMSVMYKRTIGVPDANADDKTKAKYNNEPATVVVYLWKGKKVQKSVPAAIVLSGTPNQIDMEDRDRCVLGITLDGCQGGDVETSADFELIGKNIYNIAGEQADWKELVIPIEYSSNATPTKFNVIFSANDYFTTEVGLDNTLTVDDVKLLYYSRLASLKVNGNDVTGFDPETYEYDLSDIEMPADASAITYTLLGNSGTATATVALDNDNNQALITVTNPQGADNDGKTSHVYTLKFASKQGGDTPDFPEDATIFKGKLVIEMMGGVINEGDLTDYYVYLTPNAATGNYDMSLPNFSLDLGSGPQLLGDINVEDVKCEQQADCTLRYTGKKDNLSLAGGEIVADVVCNGTETTDGSLVMKISVMWKMDESTNIPIDVTFNGTRIQTGVESVEYDNSVAPVEYFDLQGRRLSNPTNGFVIRRQGNKVEKVIL